MHIEYRNLTFTITLSFSLNDILFANKKVITMKIMNEHQFRSAVGRKVGSTKDD